MKAKVNKTWSFNNTKIEEGIEVRIIKGMEADASDVLNIPCGMCYLCELDNCMNYIPATHLTITDWSNIDWEQRRYEIAKESITAIMSNNEFLDLVLDIESNKNNREIPKAVGIAAVAFADALIEELKKTM